LTNGGDLPTEIAEVVKKLTNTTNALTELGIPTVKKK